MNNLSNLKLILFSFLLRTTVEGVPRSTKLSSHPTVLVVSFDGFRYDYMRKTSTPNLHQFQSEGVSVPWMEARFPTLTHPNYQSINTGLYPESHGVIANFLFDPLYNTTLTGNNDNPLFWNYRDDIVPLHVWNELSGEGRISGTYRWQGASTGFGRNSDLVATHRVPVYDSSDPWINRVSTVISWLTHPVLPANLVYLYYNEPDTQGHSLSPDSLEEEELYTMVRGIDSRMGYLVQELKNEGIYDSIDIIVVSDHGMETVYQSTIIDTTIFSDQSLFINYGSSPVYQLKVHDASNIQKVYQDFSTAAATRNFSVYFKEEMSRFNYSDSRRIQDIILLADSGYAFEDNIRYLNSKGVTGVHGYDNSHPNMYAFFTARGPSFKQGYKSPTPINNVDLVPMICKIIGIEPPPNNGTLRHTENLFREEEKAVNAAKGQQVRISFFSLVFWIILSKGTN